MSDFNYAFVILSFNHPELTQKTIDSVIQLRNPCLQIYLVHNGSDLKNIQILKNKYPHIEHLVINQNKGYSGGANAGLRLAFQKHEHVFFLTNDTEMIQIPATWPEKTDFFSALIFKRNTDQVDSRMGLLDTRNGRLRHLRMTKDLACFQKIEKIYIPGTAFGLSRKCFTELQGFDENLHTYWEDVDLSLRAQKAGFKLSHVDHFKLRHKIGKTCHKNRFYTLYLFQRNRRWVMKKHGYARLQFKLYFLKDMLRILPRLIIQPFREKNFLFWWKALHD